eukprot:1512521-Amphidinium_carterae.1
MVRTSRERLHVSPQQHLSQGNKECARERCWSKKFRNGALRAVTSSGEIISHPKFAFPDSERSPSMSIFRINENRGMSLRDGLKGALPEIGLQSMWAVGHLNIERNNFKGTLPAVGLQAMRA